MCAFKSANSVLFFCAFQCTDALFWKAQKEIKNNPSSHDFEQKWKEKYRERCWRKERSKDLLNPLSFGMISKAHRRGMKKLLLFFFILSHSLVSPPPPFSPCRKNRKRAKSPFNGELYTLSVKWENGRAPFLLLELLSGLFFRFHFSAPDKLISQKQGMVHRKKKKQHPTLKSGLPKKGMVLLPKKRLRMMNGNVFLGNGKWCSFEQRSFPFRNATCYLEKGGQEQHL